MFKSSLLYRELVAVDVSELGCEKAKQAEEQHDQDPFTDGSCRVTACKVENGH